MIESSRLLAGIDWAKDEHTICILDSDRRVLEERTITHSGTSISQLADQLLGLAGGDPAAVAVAIETPRGAIVETLVERGFAVYAINPKQMDRFRDRHTVAGAKDDRRDAFVLADSLRTDLHLFRRVRLDPALVIRLRELSRAEEAVTQNQVRAGNQLCELLNRYYPQMLKLCSAADETWFWDLLECFPLPATKRSKAKIAKLLLAHRIRRWDAKSVEAILSERPLILAPGAAEAASEHMLLILPQLRMYRAQRNTIIQRLEMLLEEMSKPGQFAEHRDVKILHSLPGVGRVVTVTMLAEAAQPLAERDYQALRAYGGTAPITRRSGKSNQSVMRRGCNPRLRNALYHWSRVSTQCDARSAEHYAALRAKGHSHGRALRGVADRLLAVLVAMLKSGTEYDPARRQKRPAAP